MVIIDSKSHINSNWSHLFVNFHDFSAFGVHISYFVFEGPEDLLKLDFIEFGCLFGYFMAKAGYNAIGAGY